MHFYMLMYFWIIVIVSIIMTDLTEARGRVTCICEPSLTIYCRPALLATILVVLLEYSMRICAFSVLQIVRVHDHVLMYFTPCTILYIHRQPGWHICHIILEVLSTSYWAGQIGPVKTRPDCPIPNIIPFYVSHLPMYFPLQTSNRLEVLIRQCQRQFKMNALPYSKTPVHHEIVTDQPLIFQF